MINGAGHVTGVHVWNRTDNTRFQLSGDVIINATGAWADRIAEMAHAHVPVIPSPGIMVAYDRRLSQHVINRLNDPGDGDIIIPQRRMMGVGTTSFEVKDPDNIPVLMEITFLILVVSHSLLGLRSILLDLNPSERLLKLIDGVMVLAGAGAVIYGAWLIILIAGRGA